MRIDVSLAIEKANSPKWEEVSLEISIGILEPHTQAGRIENWCGSRNPNAFDGLICVPDPISPSVAFSDRFLLAEGVLDSCAAPWFSIRAVW